MKLRLHYNKRTNRFYIEEEVSFFFSIFTKWETKGNYGGSVAGIYFSPYSYNTSKEAKLAMCEMVSVDIKNKKVEASRIARNLKDNKDNGVFELTNATYEKCEDKG